jgi:hypothetical protein
MKTLVDSKFLLALMGAFAGILVSKAFELLERFVTRHVRFQSPESELIKKILAMLRTTSMVQDNVMDVQMVQTRALIALLEASKGQINGNVDSALTEVRESERKFNGFLRTHVKPEIPGEEGKE